MKNNVNMCITESLCSTAEISTALLINFASIKKQLKFKKYLLLSLVHDTIGTSFSAT